MDTICFNKTYHTMIKKSSNSEYEQSNDTPTKSNREFSIISKIFRFITVQCFIILALLLTGILQNHLPNSPMVDLPIWLTKGLSWAGISSICCWSMMMNWCSTWTNATSARLPSMISNPFSTKLQEDPITSKTNGYIFWSGVITLFREWIKRRPQPLHEHRSFLTETPKGRPSMHSPILSRVSLHNCSTFKQQVGLQTF